MATSRLCSIPACNKPARVRGWCRDHYRRWEKHGDPLGGRVSRGVVQRYFRDVVMAYEGDECLIWPFSDTGGYGQIRHNGRPYLVTRRICEEVYGPAPTAVHHAAHSCGKGKQGCVAKRHLSWKTGIENEADKLIHGTRLRGQTCGLAKLTEAEVRQILALKGTMLQREIAAKFGVSRRNIGAIHNGRSWLWLSNIAHPSPG